MTTNEVVVERLLRVIDEGSRSSTYKLALLLSLIDIVTEVGPKKIISTRTIAEKVAEIYFRQAETFYLGDREIELKQITSKKATVLQSVHAFISSTDSGDNQSFLRSKTLNVKKYEKLLDEVENTFVRYPIPLLQRVGKQDLEFLYSIDWPENTGIKTLRKSGLDRIHLLEGVGEILIKLGPMFRNLIEIHWVQDVAKMNRLDTTESGLYKHLFGQERESFPEKLRRDLRDLQNGNCFYCRATIKGKGEVDHFLPWSRKPNNSVENLVLTDSKCNNSKRDYLVTPSILSEWEERLRTQSGELASIAFSSKWESNLSLSKKVTVNVYNSIAAGTPLWAGKNFNSEYTFEIANGPFNLNWN